MQNGQYQFTISYFYIHLYLFIVNIWPLAQAIIYTIYCVIYTIHCVSESRQKHNNANTYYM